MLLNQGIHLIDLLLWLIGERAESVYGLLGWSAGRKQTEDIAAGTIRFANGAIGIVEATTLSKPNNLDQSLTLFGDQGTISIGGADFSEVRRWHADGFASPAFPLVDMEEHAALYESFVDAVQGLPRSSLSTVTAKEARLSLEVAFALYESARIGQPVHLPLASFDTRLMSAPMEKRSEESER
jgi:predicted dehydrogenase